MPHLFSPSFRSSTLAAGLRAVGVLGLGAGFLVAEAGLAAPGATAQGLFGYWDGPPPKVRKVKRQRDGAAAQDPERASKKEDVAERSIVGPLVVNVSIARQRLTVYDATGPIAESPISSGRVGYATPTGVFTVLEKRRRHFSNLYAGAPMPNMQRLTWSGIALHAGALPGYPASHGCIRLPHGFSKKLFGMTKSGTRVIVTRDPVAPKTIAHDRLFAAFPPEADVAAADVEPTQVADASLAAGGASADAVSAVLGVSTAAAADGSTLSARASFRERRRLEAEKLSAEIRTAGYAKADKAFVLAQAQKAAQETREPLIAARAEAERLSSELNDLERAKARGERELAALQAPVEEAAPRKRKSKKTAKPARKINREERIAELTAELAELPAEIKAARVAWASADTVLKAAQDVAKAAEDKRRSAAAELMKVSSVLSQALAKEQAAKRLEAKRELPVSVFVSRAKQRLYIRQGYDDILDVPVTFDRPDEPVGTHVFTALDFTEQKTAMTWSVVSVPHDPSRRSSQKKKKSERSNKGKPEVVAVDTSVQTPKAALDRITIPDDVRDQIADVMKPGSSLVISDLSIGNETGKFTDFIVPIR